MNIQAGLIKPEEFIAELKECAQLLQAKLQQDELDAAAELIQSLVQVRDKNIFNSVGKLTRGLHDAIVNFNVDSNLSDTAGGNGSGKEMRDASDRLSYVIELTKKAADKTMDKVEESAPIASNLGQEATNLRAEWGRLKRREMTAEEFRGLYTRIDEFLEQMTEGTDQLNQNLQDIILEQGFQDLTGQTLRKVIDLVKGVEDNLVSLVSIAGQVEEITGIVTDEGELASDKNTEPDIESEGPQIHADVRNDVVSGQDEVDDLLSSLGF